MRDTKNDLVGSRGGDERMHSALRFEHQVVCCGGELLLRRLLLQACNHDNHEIMRIISH